MDANSTRAWNSADPEIEAERELGAFMKAVNDSFGSQVALHAADAWLLEVESMGALPASSPDCWRSVTIAACARLAKYLITESGYTDTHSILSSNC